MDQVTDYQSPRELEIHAGRETKKPSERRGRAGAAYEGKAYGSAGEDPSLISPTQARSADGPRLTILRQQRWRYNNPASGLMTIGP